MLGRLNLEALHHDPIVLGGVAAMILSSIAIVALLTYFKKWKWLWNNWLTSLDPKKIGVMYIIVAFIMLLRGVMDAAMMRTQQALAAGDSQGILSSDHFQQVFSAHGTIMIFFVAMGLMFGIINLVLPLQIGARDVAFPFLNSVSFWLFVAGMALINVSLVVGEFSAAGWLAYPPLSGLEYSPGVGVDYWIWSLQIAGLGSLLSGINFLVTIFKMRAPGMTLMKMPIFVHSVIGSMLLVAFAFPILTATLAMLSLDRLLGMHFFTSDFGGNPMMYINLIWAWGHPEVYILILPAFGVFSEVVATFSRKRLFGYTSMVIALIAITFLSFIVWLHHFFTMGAGADVNAFFGIMTAVIAVPTGVKVFNWLFTMFRGRIKFATPMLWFLGFVVTFTIGGMTGVLMSVPAIDFQAHNSLFLVAHFHNMIIGGVVFGYFAAFTYWFPKFFGFRLNERLGRYAFWCWLIGFLLAFIPLYILGFMGATRRLDHYDASLGWQQLFIVSAVGVMFILAGIGFQILQLIVSILQRKSNLDVSGDPWNGRNLEWSTSSPPPFYNFAVIPEVKTRDAFWEMKRSHKKAEPLKYSDIHLPKNTGFGIYIASFAFIFGFALIWHIWWLAFVALLGAIACVIIRTSQDETEYTVKAATLRRMEAQIAAGRELVYMDNPALQSLDKHNARHEADSKTIFGFWVYLMTDCLLFATLFATYAVLRNNTNGGPGGKDIFEAPYILAETLILLTSSFTCGLAMLAAHRNDKKNTLNWFGVTFLLGLTFLGMELYEFSNLVNDGHSWEASGFLSAFFTLVGTHGLHITVGLIWILVLLAQAFQKGLTTNVLRRLTLLSLFWHFLDIVWIFIFTIVYMIGIA